MFSGIVCLLSDLLADKKCVLGIPLDDNDRKEWLITLSKLLSQKVADGTGVVLACSALKVAYRNILRELHGNDDCKVVDFVFIHGTFEQFEKRIQARIGHFMPASLLKSQFDALQDPTIGESEETGVHEGKLVVVDAEWAVEKSAHYAADKLLPSK